MSAPKVRSAVTESGLDVIREAVDLISAYNNDDRAKGSLDPDAGYTEKLLHDALKRWSKRGRP